MYDFQEVRAALENDLLSTALRKLESFARSRNFNDLVTWTTAELNGDFKDFPELPDYRMVGVQWRTQYGHELPLNAGPDKDLQRMLNYLPLCHSVGQIESYEKAGFSFRIPQMAERLSAMFADKNGNHFDFHSANVSANEVQGLLKQIRAEASRRLMIAVPSGSSSAIIQAMPDFSWISDSPLKEILEGPVAKFFDTLGSCRISFFW